VALYHRCKPTQFAVVLARRHEARHSGALSPEALVRLRRRRAVAGASMPARTTRPAAARSARRARAPSLSPSPPSLEEEAFFTCSPTSACASRREQAKFSVHCTLRLTA